MPHLLLSYVMREPKCPELSSSVGDVKTVHQYMNFSLSTLKHEFNEPITAPNVSKFRLVDMYTSVTQKEVQESIVKSFSCATASLRIVVCTIAFGMAVDCAGVSHVIHWRPPADVESYMQECGRPGRNGQASTVIYVNKSDLSNRTTLKEMKYCVQQHMCWLSILCSYFDCSAAKYSAPHMLALLIM